MKPTSPFLTLLVAVMMTTAAEAHTGIGSTSAFAAGFMHPLTGLDHMLAMVAVGLWAGSRGGAALWVWPASFVGVMVVGGILGMSGLALPFVEQGILASVLLLGLAVALAARPNVAVGATLIALAALFHGHAHGTVVPANASGAAYAMGFAISTAALHLFGIAVTILAARLTVPAAVRTAGALTAAAGLVLAMAGGLA
ncbi:HupE/UreJ family protein [Phreatobacter stygius]|uniref:HupE/UreJ family protein n=1 Tax=Phreatobacter stygius TaxID=1940610 RepID=A0A4D7BDY0_9HYPH|nr:HupE/UreJ family protein [Phreatobacter stygius]QCI68785.1 HupE/UreJ family protein [Phreatobacter stygius]